MKKKIATILTAAVIGATAFTTIVSAASGDITVVSREDGSGTRGAFVELFGIEEEKDGEKVDMTTDEASVTNSTSVMMTTVAGDENAIGYISLGSLDDEKKPVLSFYISLVLFDRLQGCTCPETYKAHLQYQYI